VRSFGEGNDKYHATFFRPAQLVWLLLFLLILRTLGQSLLLGTAGAALILLLQELANPTPLFWSAPWQALQLILSRSHRVNHLWLHRTQSLAYESIARSIKPDGFAMADGFVLIGVGPNKQLVHWTADCAWRRISDERLRPSMHDGCKAIRFLVAVWLMTGALLATSIWERIGLPTALLIAATFAAAGHALARPVENFLANWFSRAARQENASEEFRLEVEPVRFPEWLWWQGGQGFIVRRTPEVEPGEG
jgi:hypothetical protein